MTDAESGTLTWRQKIVRRQSRDVPKERGETYYHSDGLGGSPQMWVKHNPGCGIPMRVEKVWPTGILPNEDYSSSLEMNIGSEIMAYRLYRALAAYFNDARTPPWFLPDVEMPDAEPGEVRV